jgi:hypothetical protein
MKKFAALLLTVSAFNFASAQELTQSQLDTIRDCDNVKFDCDARTKETGPEAIFYSRSNAPRSQWPNRIIYKVMSRPEYVYITEESAPIVRPVMKVVKPRANDTANWEYILK